MGLTLDLTSAKNYAFRLIKFRARSEKEVRDKLLKKEYPPEIIADTIACLKKTKQVDDRLFAKLWVDSRIKRSLGIARLRHELRNKGIDKNIIEEALSEAGKNYSEEAVIRKVIEHKLMNLTRLSADKKLSRLYGYLARRGYPKGTVVELLFEYIKPDEAQDTGS
ncbi:MAG: hypothetical protein AUJ74_03085 [Candidatus Omnitrophica bacterium CG1_02_44_16]|nr:MAG: hypothetical protein AUJ74_03085 [Candidatus Omnitrophica bacterium CG1_02_44_16]PIY83400.1 MAG: hypothetical protein COY78_02170 [Candidatus Omnitrophica bacterium CG_4_10_14_0_8_um_filter_44_12]